MTTKRHRSAPRFAICINTDDPDLLTPRMVYEVLPDESAAKSDYIRVIDNEGEDYLYPANHFILVDFPQAAKRALLRTGVPVKQSIHTRQDMAAQFSRKGRIHSGSPLNGLPHEVLHAARSVVVRSPAEGGGGSHRIEEECRIFMAVPHYSSRTNGGYDEV